MSVARTEFTLFRMFALGRELNSGLTLRTLRRLKIEISRIFYNERMYVPIMPPSTYDPEMCLTARASLGSRFLQDDK